MEQHLILIIDDSAADRELYKNWLSDISDMEYQFIEASSGKLGREAFKGSKPDCILLDFLMFGQDGFEFLSEMKKLYHALPPIIFLTGHHDKHIEEDALYLGATKYLKKQDLTRDKLHQEVQKAIKKID